MWTYDLQLKGNAKKLKLNKIQTYQNISLRKTSDASP